MLGHQYESSLIAFIICSSIGVLSLRECLKGVALQSLSSDKLMYVYAAFRNDALTQSHENIAILSPNQITAAEADSFIFRLSTTPLIAEIVKSEKYEYAHKLNAATVQCPMIIGANADVVFPDSYTSVLVSSTITFLFCGILIVALLRGIWNCLRIGGIL